MLSFYSGSTRVINTKRGVLECMELAMGDDYRDADLLLFHSSIGHDFNEIWTTASELAPRAAILAASCCGVVGREGVSESLKDMALMATKGKEFGVSAINGIYGYNSYEQCHKLATDLKNKCDGINMLYFMASGIDISNDECIRAIEDVFGTEVTIFGATSSDNMKGVVSYQVMDGCVCEHGAFLVGFADATLQVHTQATHGFLAFGEPLIVTKSEGNVIEELNGKPAWQEYTYHLGLHENSTCGETIPIGALAEELDGDKAAEYGNNHILRVVTKRDGNKMYYATQCKEGTQLWLTLRNEELIFREMDKMAMNLKETIGERTTVAVFHADCLARGRFLFNRIIKEELVSRMQFPFYVDGECPPWLGMYGFGEFARLGGVNTYHNYTTALYVISR